MNRIPALLILGLAALAAAKPPPGKSSAKPVFPEVKIGAQVWMAKNLDVDAFANGDKIPEAADRADWEKAGKEGKPAWCWYDFKAANGAGYGRLYNWYAVTDGRSLAPAGWRIPSKEEFETLIRVPSPSTGTGLKGTLGWEKSEELDEDYEPTGKFTGPGDNSTGFNALPGGYATASSFGGMGKQIGLWSATPKDSKEAFYLRLDHTTMAMVLWTERPHGAYVRCIKQAAP